MQKGTLGISLAAIAVLAFALMCFGSFELLLLLLVGYAVIVEKSDWLTRQTLQALYLRLAYVIATSVFSYLLTFSVSYIHLAFMGTVVVVINSLLWLCLLAAGIFGLLRVLKGQDAQIPLVCDLVELTMGTFKRKERPTPSYSQSYSNPSAPAYQAPAAPAYQAPAAPAYQAPAAPAYQAPVAPAYQAPAAPAYQAPAAPAYQAPAVPINEPPVSDTPTPVAYTSAPVVTPVSPSASAPAYTPAPAAAYSPAPAAAPAPMAPAAAYTPAPAPASAPAPAFTPTSAPAPVSAPAAAPQTWMCASCGKAGNTGKFCIQCGFPKNNG